MKYLFSWNNSYLIWKQGQKWKQAFRDKYGDENVIHIKGLDTISKDFLSESLLSRGLFSEKRLVLVEDFPLSSETSFSGASDIEKHILELLPHIPEDILVVFLSTNPDKRKAGFKELKKVAECQEFSISSEAEVISAISQKYAGKIDASAVKELVYMKGNSLEKSISELDKLLLTKDSVTLSDIKNCIIPEFEQSIFVFIDTILDKDSKKIFSDFENILGHSNLYAFYQSIIANIRTFLYISFLKKSGRNTNEIGDILKLWNRTFLINKRYRAKHVEIKKLYEKLLEFDKNMKFWKLISSEEDELTFQLRQIFVDYLGNKS